MRRFDEVRAVFETNVFGVIAITQAMLPLLREATAASIVNVSSSVGSLTLNSDPNNPHRSMFGARFIIAFWSAPTMTAGHLFFAIMTTAYILVAIQLEERDLRTIHGEQYRGYQKSVSMLTPLPRKSRP